jgi:DNA-binding response OmpR family regulator
MKILIVHRHQKVLHDAKSILQNGSYTFRYYPNGLDGLLAARVEKFDLIICGTDLPVITGFELIRSLRTQSINASTTVVFVADEVDEKAKYLGEALGVADVFTPNDMVHEKLHLLMDTSK